MVDPSYELRPRLTLKAINRRRGSFQTPNLIPSPEKRGQQGSPRVKSRTEFSFCGLGSGSEGQHAGKLCVVTIYVHAERVYIWFRVGMSHDDQLGPIILRPRSEMRDTKARELRLCNSCLVLFLLGPVTSVVGVLHEENVGPSQNRGVLPSTSGRSMLAPASMSILTTASLSPSDAA